MPERFPQLFAGLASLALGLVISAVLVAGALGRVRQGADLIEVTGSARRPAQADLIVWRATVEVSQGDLRSAYADVRRQGARLAAWLRAHGIADSTLAIGAIDARPVQEMRDGEFTGRIVAYRGTQQVVIRSRDVTGVARLAVDVSELLSEGIQLTSLPPEYVLTGLDTLRVQMLAAATEDARKRAVAIAGGAGSAVGALRAVRTGVIQVVPRHSTEVSDYGINDVSSFDKDVMAVVRVTFAIR